MSVLPWSTMAMGVPRPEMLLASSRDTSSLGLDARAKMRLTEPNHRGQGFRCERISHQWARLSASGRNQSTTEHEDLPFLIDWLSRRPTWGRGEQAVAELVAGEVRRRAPWIIAKSASSSGAFERPRLWPKSTAKHADMRALLASEGWTMLGEVGAAVNDPTPYSTDGARISLVNPSEKDVVVTFTPDRFGDEPATNARPITVTVPAENVVQRQVRVEGSSVLPVGRPTLMTLRVTSGGHAGVVTYRFERGAPPQ
jgi:hypothetical protein